MLFRSYCRYGPSVNTRRLVVEEGGFLYDSDAYNDELPYWVEAAGQPRLVVEEGGFLYDSDAYNDELPYWVRVNEKPHLVVPYSLTANDSKFGSGGFFTADDYFTFVKDGFDVLYREGKTQPKMMSLALHDRIIGRPVRVTGLIRFLNHICSKDRVWVATGNDIAEHGRRLHPYLSSAFDTRTRADRLRRLLITLNRAGTQDCGLTRNAQVLVDVLELRKI